MARTKEVDPTPAGGPGMIASRLVASASCDPIEALAERLAGEMAAAWGQGARPLAEEFLARHRELHGHPQAALRLVYEELCLREEAGQSTSTADLMGRFPQWQVELQKLLDYHSLFKPRSEPPPIPQVGETLGDFRLLAELGRGAVGRVFLAAQTSLADRPVVLKVTPGAGREHLSLARLQHTYIIPLNGVQDFPALGLRALCMPYLGGTTLARLQESMHGQEPGRRTGRQLLEALDRAQAASPVAILARGPVRAFLARSSYAHAMCWIGACLADALHYAHERELLHLDLKPSNVLLAADGQPLLLDFHLARPPIHHGGPTPEWIGGTPAYMSPEQEAALAAVRSGREAPGAVDGRSDIYALGLLLYEALGGSLPLPPEGPIELPQLNPRVSEGLTAIVRKCLAPAPCDRYQAAADLAADLRRHLADLPLRGVANRSLVERWSKLRRRQPHAPALAGMLLAVVAAALIVAAHTVAHIAQRRHAAETNLTDGRGMLDNRRYPEAMRTLARGLAMAEGLPGGRELADNLHHQLRLARRAAMAEQLHDAADRLRFLYGYDPDGVPPGPMRAIAAQCLALWESRGRVLAGAGAELGPDVERRIQADVVDLAVLWGDLHVRLAGGQGQGRAHREALRMLDEAEATLPPSPLLCRARQAHARALGLDYVARAAGRRAAELIPQTAWDHQAAGLSLLRSGEVELADVEFRCALERRPQDFWPNFYRGICAFRLRRYEDAVGAFGICVALAPESAECSYNLARARQALGEAGPALQDYDRALRLDPTMSAAALNRGLLHFQQSRHEDATADFKRALDHGADPAIIHYNTALVELARGDPQAAEANLRRALRSNPGHGEARELSDRLHRERPYHED